jgi:F-type H+-transporting ATPase subunit b
MAETINTEVGARPVIEDEHGFPPFNPANFASQLVWLAITFGIFYLIISRVAAPRIAGILEDRKAKIAVDLGEAARLKSETDASIAGYEKSLAEARRNAASIAAETRAKLTAEIDAKRHVAEAGLAEKLARAEADIAAIKAKAMGEVDAIARETASSVVAALSSAQVSADEIEAAVSAASAR